MIVMDFLIVLTLKDIQLTHRKWFRSSICEAVFFWMWTQTPFFAYFKKSIFELWPCSCLIYFLVFCIVNPRTFSKKFCYKYYNHQRGHSLDNNSITLSIMRIWRVECWRRQMMIWEGRRRPTTCAKETLWLFK